MSSCANDDAREKDLQSLWAGAYDAWIDVPGESEAVVYARPILPDQKIDANGKDTCAFPSIVTHSRCFALTAFNPMGVKTDVKANKEKNETLKSDLLHLTRPRPKALWSSFGFSRDWREDGFVVAFEETDADAGRDAIVRLAVRYEQGAIYEYVPVAEREDGEERNEMDRKIRENALLRKTVPAAMGASVEADALLERCLKPDISELAERTIRDELY
jgi:hypothetical protein